MRYGRMAETNAMAIGRQENESRSRLDGKRPALPPAATRLNTSMRPRPMCVPKCRPDRPQDPGLVEEDEPVRASAMPSALRMPICLVFWDGGDGQRGRYPQHHGDDHEHLDHDGRRGLALERREQLAVLDLPIRDGQLRELPGHLARHPRGREDVTDLYLHGVHLARRAAEGPGGRRAANAICVLAAWEPRSNTPSICPSMDDPSASTSFTASPGPSLNFSANACPTSMRSPCRDASPETIRSESL